MKLWEARHPYYCTEGNYFTSQKHHQTIWPFKSWAEFLAEMGDADLDYNLLFRWDWQEGEDYELAPYNGDDNYRNGRLLLFFMHQRKGYHSTSVVEVCRADEPAVRSYLEPRLAHLLAVWAPLDSAEADRAHGITGGQHD